MEFQTKIPIKREGLLLNYQSNILLLGSCFSEHISEKLEYYKFRSLSNPFGILFHPVAIENLISRSISGRFYSVEDLFNLNERWNCYDAHSDLSAASADNTLENLNKGLKSTNFRINESTHIFITLGTAWVYRLKQSGHIVANCHKVPQNQFDKVLLTVDELVACLRNIEGQIRSVRADAEIIWTVSPVRHLKDGFVENTRSKAHLVAAIHQVTDSKGCSYFPSYELLMDELRDYRFYNRDMVHPNEIAVDYIWEKFRHSWIDPQVYPAMEKVGKVQKGLLHRPFDATTESHKRFRNQLERQIRELKDQFPFMDFEVAR